ncbi:MAG: FAD-binding oxidoreductase [Candidatus Bathyarchaeia archaeon]
MVNYRKVTLDLRGKLESIVSERYVSDAKEDLEKHSKDESLAPPHLPEVVVKPGTVNEVSTIMRLAYENLIPVTPQGSRTGLSGAAHPIYGGIALSFERMNKIIEIDEENMMVVVEPGVLIMDLHAETEKRGLLYPPDPGQESGTIGGNISTNAGGVRGMKYGVTRDFVQGLEVVLANGSILNLGGKNIKNSTGYSLIDLIVGSEGTLAVVTKAILKLVPKPRHTALLYVPFNSTREAIRVVPEIIKRKVVPFAIEFMPQHAVLTAERYLERHLPDSDHSAYLLIGVEGNSPSEVDNSLEVIGEVCLELGGLNAFIAETQTQQQQLWEARKCLFDAYKSFYEIDEVDICVPCNRIPDYIDLAEKIAESNRLLIVNIGHAGDGNVHSIIARGEMEREEWLNALDKTISELISVGLNLGGTVSGEHGLGYTKKNYLELKVGKTQVELMKSIKRAFDPNDILNPGKVFD